jgi:hypothetical protein
MEISHGSREKMRKSTGEGEMKQWEKKEERYYRSDTM